MKHMDLKQMELDTAAAKVDELTKQLESLWSDSPAPPGPQAGVSPRVSLIPPHPQGQLLPTRPERLGFQARRPTMFFCFCFFGSIGFELRVLYSLGRHSTT
jgi:hypothetical protein